MFAMAWGMSRVMGMKQTLLILMAMVMVGCVTYDWTCSRCGGGNTVTGFGTIRCIKCGKILPDDKKLEAEERATKPLPPSPSERPWTEPRGGGSRENRGTIRQ